MFNSIPVKPGCERIEIFRNLAADVNLDTGRVYQYLGCVDAVKNPKIRRKIIKCEIRRLKR